MAAAIEVQAGNLKRPLVVLIAEEDRSERLFDIFVAKPFDERELGEQLRSLLVGNTGAD
jgi:hypothetical protein